MSAAAAAAAAPTAAVASKPSALQAHMQKAGAAGDAQAARKRKAASKYTDTRNSNAHGFNKQPAAATDALGRWRAAAAAAASPLPAGVLSELGGDSAEDAEELQASVARERALIARLAPVRPDTRTA